MRYGYFDNANREYGIDRVDIPVPRTNYIGLKDMYDVINPTAGSAGSVPTAFPWTAPAIMCICGIKSRRA